MSVSSSLSSATSAPITFSGLASGLNTTSIIQKLMSIDQQPVTQLQSEVTADQNQQQVYSQLQSLVQTFEQAASGLNEPSAFNTVSASSSAPTVASLSTDGTALAGTYNLTVTQLAQAEKISSSAQTNLTSALNLSGVAVINGASFTISPTDSLTTITQNINNLNVGVTASVVNGGAGNAFLTLTSTKTGAANAIQMADMTGSALQSLGLTNGTTAVRSAITNGAQSYGLSSATSNLQGLLGQTTSGTIQINGTNVPVDFSTDSLQTIANSINSDVSGVSASVQTVTNNNTTTYQLQITGTSGTPTFTDSNHVLESIGVLQQGTGNQIVAAKDAAFSLDNVNLTSPSNTDTTAIPGATLTLLQGTTANPGTSTLSLTQNTSGIVSSLQTFVSAYNAVNDYITQNSTFDASTFATGPLFGDPIADQIQNQMSNMLFQNVSGDTGAYQNLASLGFTFDSTGDLNLDTSAVSTALSSNPQGVAQLFEATGNGSTADLTYVNSNASSVPSANGPYAVNITQLPTMSSYVAGTAQTQPASNSETLTFGGALFNSVPTTIILNVGATLAQTVSQINADPQLNSHVLASINTNGALEIDSKKYGTIGNFTVSSNLAAGTDNSGVGTAGAGTMTSGIDIGGTINGEAATGQGQFLTGSTGNKTTAGLEIQYTGNATGIVGTMSFSSGIANNLSNLAKSFADPNSGLIADENNSLTTQITNYNNDITTLQAQLTLEQQNLTTEFNNMESAIATLQQQGNSLSEITAAEDGTSSSSSSSGTSSSGTSSSTSGLTSSASST